MAKDDQKREWKEGLNGQLVYSVNISFGSVYKNLLTEFAVVVLKWPWEMHFRCIYKQIFERTKRLLQFDLYLKDAIAHLKIKAINYSSSNYPH